ncbi:MAG: tetratricopeptide repeat protein [Spirochaetaceae bacterium]|nr:tetratricopeptide repeat protein [Spirochaetaceae bacterium]
MDKSIAGVKESIASLLQVARESLKNGDFEKAKTDIEKALSIDFNDKLIINGLKFVNFWIERKMRFQTVEGHYERGCYLFRQWKAFIAFSGKFDITDDELTIYAIKFWVFNQALHHFNQLYENGADDHEIIIKIGLCHKNLGDYCRALEYLEIVMQAKHEDAELMAEIADCYAFINEVKASKIFFREAFFIDPQSIDLYSLESLLIKKLIGRVKSLGFDDKLLNEWIPIYGVLYGVFNVKRELKVLELGKLKQSISALEHQYDEDVENRAITVPRLLNRYFWLIDYYISTNDSKDRIEDVLRKMNKVNPSVYELYSN